MNKQQKIVVVNKQPNARGSSRSQKRPRNRRNLNKRRKNNPGSARQAPRLNYNLSPCSTKYLCVQTDPFNERLAGVCIPDLIDLPSAKYRCLSKGTIETGTTGFGFIILRPQNALWKDGTLLEGNTIGIKSTLTYDNANVNPTPGAGEAIAIKNPTAPYTYSEVMEADESTIQGRLVGCGIRVRYLGKEIDKGGRVLLYRIPYGMDSDGLTADDILNDPSSISVPNRRQWISCAFVPQVPRDVEYSQATNSIVPAYNVKDRILVYIEAPDTESVATYEYEIVTFIEYIGVVLNKTPSDSDITGISAVRGVMNSRTAISQTSKSDFTKALKDVKETASTVSSGFQTALNVAKTAAQIGSTLLLL